MSTFEGISDATIADMQIENLTKIQTDSTFRARQKNGKKCSDEFMLASKFIFVSFIDAR